MNGRKCIKCGSPIIEAETSCKHCHTPLDMSISEGRNLRPPLKGDTSSIWLNKINDGLLQNANSSLERDENLGGSIGDLLGNLDAGGLLILVSTVTVIVLIAVFIGIYLGAYFPDHEAFIYLVAAIPAVIVGMITWNLLFRIKKWLRR